MTVNQAHSMIEGTTIAFGKARTLVAFVKTSRSNTKATYITARKQNGELIEARCRHFCAVGT